MNKQKLLTVFLLFFSIASHCGKDNSLAEQSINLPPLPREIWAHSLTLSFEPEKNVENIINYQSLSMVSRYFQHADFFNALVVYLQKKKVSYLGLLADNECYFTLAFFCRLCLVLPTKERICFNVDAKITQGIYKRQIPLMYASKNNNLDLVKLLIEDGADVNLVDNRGWTALMLACKYNNSDLIVPLINAGADINVVNYSDLTLLMIACVSNNLNVAKLLIEAGADVMVDTLGFTALMTACKYSPEIVPLLLEAGADVNVEGGCGKTALSITRLCNPQLVSLLLEHGATK